MEIVKKNNIYGPDTELWPTVKSKNMIMPKDRDKCNNKNLWVENVADKNDDYP